MLKYSFRFLISSLQWPTKAQPAVGFPVNASEPNHMDHPLRPTPNLHQHKPPHITTNITVKDLTIHKPMHVRLAHQRVLPHLARFPQHKEIFRPTDQPDLVPWLKRSRAQPEMAPLRTKQPPIE